MHSNPTNFPPIVNSGAAFEDLVHLALETTGRKGSLAVLRGQQVVQPMVLDPRVRTAAALAPQVDRALEESRRRGEPIAMVSIADGPGSFTGLRIGVTTAKTLSYALRLPLVAVDSLAAIAAAAFQLDAAADSICVGLDAYRGQVFCGVFRRRDLLPAIGNLPPDWTAHPPGVRVLTREQWEELLEELPIEIPFAGDAKLVSHQRRSRIDPPCHAAGVGLLAVRARIAGHEVDPLALSPRYLKVSAAEEKL